MKEYIERGDKIRIENRRVESGGYGKLDTIIATITNMKNEHGNIQITMYSEDNPRTWDSYTGGIIDSQIEAILCIECDNEKIYHDNKDDYLCPWCEL